MNRNLQILLFSLMLLSMGAPLQAASQFEEELHYFSIIPEQPGGEGNRVQVVEFFWYACPHCFSLEPHLKDWLGKKPENIDFVRIPAMFNRDNVVMHAKTYYALELMGVDPAVHDRIFEAMHDDKRVLDNQQQMEAYLKELGLDLGAYRKAMTSFAVQTQARRASVLAQRFDVRGVPAIVVDGKYRTSGLDGDVLIKVTDYLIDRVKEEKGVN